MATAFAFGTYIPGVTPLHKLNAQVKVILTCAFIISVFFVGTWIGLGALIALVVFGYVLAHIPITKALNGLKPIIFILAFTFIVHVFSINVYAQPAPGLSSCGSLGFDQKLVFWGSFGMTLDGAFRGLYFTLRIALLIAVCSLLTFTTSLVMLVDALSRLFGPLRRFGVPVDDLAMMLSIALRFIPTTAQEAANISLAQKARCAEFDTGGLIARIKSWVPVFIPLFARLFKRADDLANAMDARCYFGRGRTSAQESHLRAADIICLIFVLALMAVLCCLF